MKKNYRNVAIIAHVDHGKTTLVDQLLQAGGVYRANEEVTERAMDSMDLEREKGITIRAKNASIHWHGVTINIVDTPGHADFGGEVERIMGMVDGVLLLVDAADGPQAQTRFVLKKALQHNLKLVVVINKIDRDHARPAQVHDQVLELLLELHADEEQFNAPFIYASARDGYAMRAPGDPRENMTPLLEAIVTHIPPPAVRAREPFRMLVSNLDWSDYVGRIAIGKVLSGHLDEGDPAWCLLPDGGRKRGIITKIFEFSGLGTSQSIVAAAGNIVGLAGFEDACIGATLAAREDQDAIPFTAIDPPTIQMLFRVNDGPLAGRDGKYLTARHLRERLVREIRGNVSLGMADTEWPNVFRVSARGELQIAILVEQMRREGFEVLVSRPEIIPHEENGQRLEPFESLWLDVPNNRLGDVLQQLAGRRAQVLDMVHHGTRVHLEAVIPTRGLIGLEGDLTNLTGGEAVLTHLFKEYGPLAGAMAGRNSGTLVATHNGVATAYALDQLQQRGRLFIGPGDQVYEGMIIGENPRAEDMPVNPTRTKHLTNVRSHGEGKGIMLEPPVIMSLEQALEYIADDEYVEATPHFLRLRKQVLNATLRKRAAQSSAASVA